MEYYRVEIILKAIGSFKLPRHSNLLSREIFLALLQRANSSLFQSFSEVEKQIPYSCSRLRKLEFKDILPASFRSFPKEFAVGDLGRLSLNFIADELFETTSQFEGLELSDDYVKFKVVEVRNYKKVQKLIPYQEIYELKFFSPLFFLQDGKNSPWPEPVNLIQSLINKWNIWKPTEPLKATKSRIKELGELITVLYANGKVLTFDYLNNIRQNGWIGTVKLKIMESKQNPVIHKLLSFGLICNAGEGSAIGHGEYVIKYQIQENLTDIFLSFEP